MLGSHNSISYLKAIHWWQRWQKRWYKCQEHTIDEQLASGIRYFDIRLKIINNEWHFVHNKIDFGVENLDIYKSLNSIGNKVYVRFVLDERKHGSEEYRTKFLRHINWVKGYYPNIIVNSIITAWDWREHEIPEIAERELHASVNNSLIDYILYGTKICRPIVIYPNIPIYNQYLIDNDKVLLVDYV